MEDMVSRKRQASGSNNGRTKITPEIVLKIRESSKTQDELAKEFGISQSQVGRIKTWCSLEIARGKNERS